MTRTQLSVRFTLAALLAAGYAAIIATAGPGNGHQAAPQLREALVLPTVVVVAQRPAVAVNAAAVKQVNLAR